MPECGRAFELESLIDTSVEGYLQAPAGSGPQVELAIADPIPLRSIQEDTSLSSHRPCVTAAMSRDALGVSSMSRWSRRSGSALWLCAAAAICPMWAASHAAGQDTWSTPIADSPAFYTYSMNTYAELGWIDVDVPEHRGIANWSIDYTWNTLDDFMGTFYAQSPAGTVFTIGFAEAAGTYTKPTDDFNDEWADGTWTFWVEDVQGFGEQQAVNITWTLTFVDADQPFGLIAETYGDSAIVTWEAAAEQPGLLGYRVYRDGSPIADVDPGLTTYTDEALPLGPYCYHATAIYGAGEGGPSNQNCTTIYPAGTYGLADSPVEPIRYHSYAELGWTEFEVIDRGVVLDWSISLTWTNTNGFTDGSLHAESPSGTLVTLGSFMTDGAHTIPTAAFNGEPSHGIWRIWIEDDDTFGDGQYRVTNATVTLGVDRSVPTDLIATPSGPSIALSWVAPPESIGLTGYDLYRDDLGGTPLLSLDAMTTAHIDATVASNRVYCYQVAAVYGATEALWPFDACSGAAGVYTIPDSPPPNQPNTYYYNSFTEAGWIEFEVSGMEAITGWHLSYNWEANWAWPEGRFYVLSPAGTQVTILSGQPAGPYDFATDAFNDEPANGTWRLWIVDEDFFYDGMFRATDIVMTIDTGVSEPIPATTSWGMLVLALLLLTAGTSVFSRRRGGHSCLRTGSP